MINRMKNTKTYAMSTSSMSAKNNSLVVQRTSCNITKVARIKASAATSYDVEQPAEIFQNLENVSYLRQAEVGVNIKFCFLHH